MGCDIHMFAEVSKNGNWQKVGRVFANDYYDPEKPTSTDEDGYVWNAEKTEHPYDSRNYKLFGILANVRNGRGFAGCDTGDPLTTIDLPRGLPDDVSPEVKKESDDWGVDGHSHSWFTVAELLRFDWDQIAVLRGWVDRKNYEAYKKNGWPNSWSGMVSGGRVTHISNSQMDALAEGILQEDGFSSYFTQVQWEKTYRDYCKEFLEKSLPALRSLGDPDEVRIVFWFDN